ncbi:3-ketoacyl-CoA thiolase, mitochondrial-like [Manduca sexta]|uniref:3-ketoacyl-CoA thiolase, mitochondrial-like n=1 Tax=Manduca sexta TaxID=7130 RepID=UPI00188F2036|nr:3-ketoacyl-CoA thiolase, mitochondrial-like [Manduca sexta]
MRLPANSASLQICRTHCRHCLRGKNYLRNSSSTRFLGNVNLAEYIPGVYIVAGKRTAIGKYGGVLRDVKPQDLFAAAARAAFEASGVPPELVDTVNIGQTSSMSPGGLAPRHAALAAGVPREKPVVSTTLLSGSAINSTILSTQEILIGSAHVSLAGGMEVLSGVPFLVRGVRTGVPLGANILLDDMNISGLFDTYCKATLIETSDKLAKKYGITRQGMDEFALRSQRYWKAAHDNGVFDAELVPVMGKFKGKDVLLSRDESPRPNTTLEQLAKLPPIVAGSLLTAGNNCGINDGAGAIILASEDAVRQHKLKPLSRVAAWSRVGVDPTIMGIGLAVAAQKLLDAACLRIDDIDLVEVHETNAAVAVASVKHLGIEEKQLNLSGGAIAIGHPSGASGARLISHITHELRRKHLRRGLASMCVAGGQGIAILIKNADWEDNNHK